MPATKPIVDAGPGPDAESLIRKTAGVCGGAACIRDTRIMVWLLADLRRQGANDEEILEGYPSLSKRDLRAAWDYERSHQEEITDEIASQEKDG